MRKLTFVTYVAAILIFWLTVWLLHTERSERRPLAAGEKPATFASQRESARARVASASGKGAHFGPAVAGISAHFLSKSSAERVLEVAKVTPEVRSHLLQLHFRQYLIEHGKELNSQQRQALLEASRVDWWLGWGGASEAYADMPEEYDAAYQRHLEIGRKFHSLGDASEALRLAFPQAVLDELVPFQRSNGFAIRWIVNGLERPFFGVTGRTFHGVSRALRPYQRKAQNIVSVLTEAF